MLRVHFHFVLCTMLGLLLVGARANGQSDDQTSSAAQVNSDRAELTVAVEAILKSLSGTELDKGFDAMTPQGADEFAATILWEAASAALIRPEPGTALPEGTKELKAVGLKYGLGKVKNPMPDLFALISKSPEEQVKYLTEHMEKTQLSLLGAVKPEQRREAVKEISDTLLKANRPDPKLSLGQSKIFDYQWFGTRWNWRIYEGIAGHVPGLPEG